MEKKEKERQTCLKARNSLTVFSVVRQEPGRRLRPGLLRRKPGRGEPTSSKSCSDKLALWGSMGLQGCLLASVIAEPIGLSSVTVLLSSSAGAEPTSELEASQLFVEPQEALERALLHRLVVSSVSEPVRYVAPPRLCVLRGPTELNLLTAVAARGLEGVLPMECSSSCDTEPSGIGRPELHACGSAVNWHVQSGSHARLQPLEATVASGLLLGASQKRLKHDRSGCLSRLSPQRMLGLLASLGSTGKMRLWKEPDAKQCPSIRLYQQRKAHLLGGSVLALAAWQRKLPEQYYDFAGSNQLNAEGLTVSD
jgi:hypothetical protein